MCAILDNDVCAKVFGEEERPEAGKRFFDWIHNGSGRLVIGGRLRSELYKNQKFKMWANTAIKVGKLKEFDDDAINQLEGTLDSLRSNDAHIIALAKISHARVLCTNDRKLKEDFKDRKIINKPKGAIYSIPDRAVFEKQRKFLQKHSCKK